MNMLVALGKEVHAARKDNVDGTIGWDSAASAR